MTSHWSEAAPPGTPAWAELDLGAGATLESPADPPEILELVLYDDQGTEVPTGPDDWARDDLYESVIQSASTY